jgi:hypothetical protein
MSLQDTCQRSTRFTSFASATGNSLRNELARTFFVEPHLTHPWASMPQHFLGFGELATVPAICASEDQEDANEDFAAGGSLPRLGGGVLQSCRHHADAADAGSIPRHGPPLSYSGRDAWEKGASQPPKGALEAAEIQVWKEAPHSCVAQRMVEQSILTDDMRTRARGATFVGLC